VPTRWNSGSRTWKIPPARGVGKVAKEFGWAARGEEEKSRPRRRPGVRDGQGFVCGGLRGGCLGSQGEQDQGHARLPGFRVRQDIEPGEPARTGAGRHHHGLGAALREEMQFENGAITSASFRTYQVPRFDDVPELDIHLMDRPDLASAGAGETPIIVIAPAVANAVFHATGKNVRALPVRLAAA